MGTRSFLYFIISNFTRLPPFKYSQAKRKGGTLYKTSTHLPTIVFKILISCQFRSIQIIILSSFHGKVPFDVSEITLIVIVPIKTKNKFPFIVEIAFHHTSYGITKHFSSYCLNRREHFIHFIDSDNGVISFRIFGKLVTSPEIKFSKARNDSISLISRIIVHQTTNKPYAS